MAAANQAVPPALLGVAKKDAAFRKSGKSGTGHSGGRGRGRKPMVSPVSAFSRKCCVLAQLSTLPELRLCICGRTYDSRPSSIIGRALSAAMAGARCPSQVLLIHLYFGARQQ